MVELCSVLRSFLGGEDDDSGDGDGKEDSDMKNHQITFVLIHVIQARL